MKVASSINNGPLPGHRLLSDTIVQFFHHHPTSKKYMHRIFDNLQTHVRMFADNLTTLSWCTQSTTQCITSISKILTLALDPSDNGYESSVSFRDMQWRQHQNMFAGDVAVLTSSEDEYNENNVLIFQRPDRWHILYHTIINMYMLNIGMYIVMDDEV